MSCFESMDVESFAICRYRQRCASASFRPSAQVFKNHPGILAAATLACVAYIFATVISKNRVTPRATLSYLEDQLHVILFPFTEGAFGHRQPPSPHSQFFGIWR